MPWAPANPASCSTSPTTTDPGPACTDKTKSVQMNLLCSGARCL